jgi:hypothetical protein
MFVIHLMIPIFLTDPYQNLDRSQSKLRQISCPLPNKFNEKKTVSDPRCKQTFGDWYFQFFITFHIINVMRNPPKPGSYCLGMTLPTWATGKERKRVFGRLIIVPQIEKGFKRNVQNGTGQDAKLGRSMVPCNQSVVLTMRVDWIIRLKGLKRA